MCACRLIASVLRSSGGQGAWQLHICFVNTAGEHRTRIVPVTAPDATSTAQCVCGAVLCCKRFPNA